MMKNDEIESIQRYDWQKTVFKNGINAGKTLMDEAENMLIHHRFTLLLTKSSWQV